MKNINNKLGPTLIDVFTEHLNKKLTIKEIREHYLKAYQNKTGLELDADALRKWLYRKIYKMIEKGEVSKTYDEGGTTAKYQLQSAHFDQSPKDVTAQLEATTNDNINDQEIFKILKEKEAKYEADFNISIGESDEYKRICESYPILKSALITEYEQASNKKSVLAGRLAAIRKTTTQLRFEDSSR